MFKKRFLSTVHSYVPPELTTVKEYISYKELNKKYEYVSCAEYEVDLKGLRELVERIKDPLIADITIMLYEIEVMNKSNTLEGVITSGKKYNSETRTLTVWAKCGVGDEHLIEVDIENVLDYIEGFYYITEKLLYKLYKSNKGRQILSTIMSWAV